MSLITIDQLLESVDLDFEPRWVTKDNGGAVWVWSGKPDNNMVVWNIDYNSKHIGCAIGKIKLAEFDGKDWTECIYEVPRKVVISKMETTGKIEHIKARKSIDCSDRPEAHIEKHRIFVEIWDKINELADAVNELKGAKNE